MYINRFQVRLLGQNLLHLVRTFFIDQLKTEFLENQNLKPFV